MMDEFYLICIVWGFYMYEFLKSLNEKHKIQGWVVVKDGETYVVLSFQKIYLESY